MKFLIVLFSIAAIAKAGIFDSLTGKNLILEPISGKTGEARALIFITGA